MEIDVMKYVDVLSELAVKYGMKIVGALIVLIIGLWIVKVINSSIKKALSKRKIDESLQPFLRSLFSALLKVMLGITVMSMLGIEMTSFVAILGAAGLAVGLALSGTLQNFAGGVMILILRPYKVGDLIEFQGYTGTVKEIQIFNTHLNTVDNKLIIIPNTNISSSSLINYTAEEKRRVDFTFGISYDDDIEKAKSVVTNILTADERVHNEPAPFVRLAAMADSSLNLTTRAWVNTADYWDVFFDTNEKVLEAFRKEGISIPYPQMDVHLQKDN